MAKVDIKLLGTDRSTLKPFLHEGSTNILSIILCGRLELHKLLEE